MSESRALGVASSTIVSWTSNPISGGRPTDVPIDEGTLEFLVSEDYSNMEIAQYFGATVDAIKGLKKRRGP